MCRAWPVPCGRLSHHARSHIQRPSFPAALPRRRAISLSLAAQRPQSPSTPLAMLSTAIYGPQDDMWSFPRVLVHAAAPLFQPGARPLHPDMHPRFGCVRRSVKLWLRNRVRCEG